MSGLISANKVRAYSQKISLVPMSSVPVICLATTLKKQGTYLTTLLAFYVKLAKQ